MARYDLRTANRQLHTGGRVTSHQQLLRFLAENVLEGVIDEKVVAALLPEDGAHENEAVLWDYKRGLPFLPEGPTTEHRDQHKAEIADLMKDAVSFYNVYGGYLVFGVEKDGADRIIGCSGSLDIDDFNKKLVAATGHQIECLLKFMTATPTGRRVGLMLVPRRPDSLEPASFRRAAPAYASGKRAYAVNDVYGRFMNECRPATANSGDWRFLHGPRRVEGQATTNTTRTKVRASVPARDPDLVSFVGRERYLSCLRRWLGDPRSPVRLLTGIGGLGKTSIAYHFVEEVISLGNAEIERVIWLSAKARTFSAIRGEMIDVGRTDFDDPASLYRVILDRLGYAPAWEDDNPTDADLTEAILEAITVYNCLIVIDDLDSLAPEAQKEVVFGLTACASRTVDGVRQPSRFLFTSRVDQGFPPAHVVKVEGFELDEFRGYVKSVAAALQVTLPDTLDYDYLRTQTSGSPLFAASLLRLLRFGENIVAAAERWAGHEGIDVRRFAFERELRRLSVPAARVLYAVCLLGETSTVELAQVLEMTQVAVSDRLSELQAYHLLATAVRQQGGAAIVAPDDVVLTKDVLRNHLHDDATAVERACGKARLSEQQISKKVAASIGRVIGLWRDHQYEVALIEAQRLEKEHPDNGDVQCLLGCALIKPRIVRWADADKAFGRAYKAKSSRSELLENWIAAKRHLEDWRGLIDITTGKTSARGGLDRALRANVQARYELIKAASRRGDPGRVAELAREGMEGLARQMARASGNRGEIEEMQATGSDFARWYVDGLVRLNRRPDDQFKIFDAVSVCQGLGLASDDILLLAQQALVHWWTAVEERKVIDEQARDILRVRLARLEAIERDASLGGAKGVEAKLRATRLDLAHRGSKVSST